MTAGEADHWFDLGIRGMDQGRADEAESAFRKVLALEPRHARANINLGMLLEYAENDAEAELFYRAAVQSDAALARAWFNLGALLQRNHRLDEAIDCFRRALALDAGQASWHSALGRSLREAGEVEDALAALRRALELAPETEGIASDYLHALNFASGESPEKIFQEHLAWAGRRGTDGHGATHENDPESARKLRVGYLAPDFGDPSLACLIEPALEHHERRAFEVLCYSDAQAERGDAWRMRGQVELWHATAQMSNEQLADRIREDRIDVLVDLAGHSAGGKRVPLFEQKPAPVQISWLGYPCTTGLRSIDYRILDPFGCPPPAENLYAERVLRMPESRWCYKPPPEAPEPGPPPCAANGATTFGSFRDLSDLSRHTTTLWTKVLRALPESRLLIAARGAPALASRIGERFRAEGIDLSRIALLDRDPTVSALPLYAQVDIVLDAFPCAGVATTFDSLWMGVPVVTLSGRTEASRSGAGILSGLGMDALVAGSDDEYVQLAVSLAKDPRRLAEWRRNLRPRLAGSSSMNARRFASGLEALYRKAWLAWCAGNSGPRESVRQSAAVAGTAPPRVVVDGVFFQDYETGIARVWRTLFQEWVNSGFARNILLLDRAGTAPKIPGLRMRTVPRHSYDRLDEDRAMLQSVCDEEHATVFTSTYYSTPLATPVVMMVHDMIPEVLKLNLTEPAWREKAHCIGRASRFVAVSRSTARDLRRIHPEVPPGSIAVAHNGVDALFRPAKAARVDDFRRRHGLGGSYFLFVGGRAFYKNAAGFFRAFARLPERSRYDVLCVGSMRELGPEERAACAGSSVRTHLLSDEDLRLAYCGALALVYPSLYEGFGMPVIEAMASGCPVITTSHASLPEVAGDAAIYVNPFDHGSLTTAMVQVQKPELRAALQLRGIERAKLFSWAAMARSVAAVWSGV